MNEFLSCLYGALAIIIVGFVTYLGTILRTLIIVKIANSKNEHLKYVATLIFNGINEDKRIGVLAGEKIDAFESRIKAVLPNVTDSQIYKVRQGIAGEFNKDKIAIVKALEPVIATATKKYYDDEGIELVKKAVEVITPVANTATATKAV